MFPQTIPNELFLMVLGRRGKKDKKKDAKKTTNTFAFHYLLQLLLHLWFPNLSLEYALYSNSDIILVADGNLTA